jgi:hypothetical protein
VPVGHVEASESTTAVIYAPNPAAFIAGLPDSRPGFTITYNPPLGTPPVYSGHAIGVGNVFYGDGSMARGVTTVQAWYANTWINQVLRAGSAQPPDTTGLPRVSNHSYIATISPMFTLAQAEDVLRRADFLVDQGSHVMVVGVGSNGRSTPSEPAPVFGSGYNVITVGRSDGQHESGLTTVAGPGRVKPDLVAPTGTVSSAAPIVAAAATLLVQVAGADPLASDPRTVKAVLMAGATKDEPEFAGTWSRTQTQPLDPRFGAGELNIDASHRILTAGRQPASPTATVARTGWDRNAIGPPVGPRTYFFDVPTGDRVTLLSAVLTWNRAFPAGTLASESLADLNLTLHRASGFTLVGDPLDSSTSTVDNVEHVYATTGLDAGRYAFVVDMTGTTPADYALAWQVQTAPVPEPAAGLAVAAVGVATLRLRRRLAPGSGTTVP